VALAAAVRELADLSSARISAETALRSSRSERTIARDVLKGLLTQADLTARALDCDKFRSPRRPSDHSLVVCARAFATDIDPIKKEFIVYGLSPDQVTAAATALERTLLNYVAAKAKRSAAIREFEEKLEVAMTYMRRFEALVANTLADNPATMAEWTVARKINRSRIRKRIAGLPPNVAEPVVQPKAA